MNRFQIVVKKETTLHDTMNLNLRKHAWTRVYDVILETITLFVER